MATEKWLKNCDNCMYSGRPSYEYPCTACTSAYGSAPSKWESFIPIPVDMVEVVRCEDCKYRVIDTVNGEDWCNHTLGLCGEVYATDFCCHGEREDNG